MASLFVLMTVADHHQSWGEDGIEDLDDGVYIFYTQPLWGVLQ